VGGPVTLLAVTARRCSATPPPWGLEGIEGSRHYDQDLSERELVLEHLASVVVRKGRLEISLNDPNAAKPKRLDLPWLPPASRRTREIVGPPAEGSERRPMRAEAPAPAAQAA
jgi:hypothetical protein